jgi:hypothetical protein
VSGSTKNGQLAVSLWRKVLEISPADATGEIRESLAFALMSVNSLKESVKYANDVVRLRASDPGFCYNYACLMSRINAPEKSLEWLDASIKRGNSNVAWARKDPDLQRVRQSHGKQFAQLVTPKWSWRVTDDWLWDDVILKNESLFPLSNITLSVTLNKGRGQKNLKLTCEYLAPGDSKKWVDIVDGAEGTWDNSSTASLTCDQTE